MQLQRGPVGLCICRAPALANTTVNSHPEDEEGDFQASNRSGKMRIRIEIEDKGLKSSHEFEAQNMDGEALRDRIVGFLSASGVFEGADERSRATTSAHDYNSGGTLMGRLESFIRYEFSDTWFTTQELREKYETVADDIKLSTVSTYLSRMNRDGLLDRKGNRNNRQYRLIEKAEPEMISQHSVQRQNTYERRKAEGRW